MMEKKKKACAGYNDKMPRICYEVDVTWKLWPWTLFSARVWQLAPRWELCTLLAVVPALLQLSINLREDSSSASVDLIHHTVLGTLYQFIRVPVFVLHGQNLHSIIRLQHFVHCVPWPSLYIYTLFSTAVTKIWLTRWRQLCKPPGEPGRSAARVGRRCPGLAQD